MTAPITFTGTTKAWTSSTWRDLDYVLGTVKGGDHDQAASELTYTNSDMSGAEGWAEVGVATITVTFHPRDEIVSKELEGLNQQLQKVRAENVMRENAILDRISKLTAITFEGDLS